MPKYRFTRSDEADLSELLDLLRHARTFSWKQDKWPEFVEIHKITAVSTSKPWQIEWPDPDAPDWKDHPFYKGRYPYHPLTRNFASLEEAYDAVQELLGKKSDPEG